VSGRYNPLVRVACAGLMLCSRFGGVVTKELKDVVDDLHGEMTVGAEMLSQPLVPRQGPSSLHLEGPRAGRR
jgi:hypothetical protein